MEGMFKMKPIYRSEEGKNEIISRYEEILKQWPCPCEHINVSTSFGETFVTASGNKTGKAIILLHGSSSNSAMWIGDAAVLGKTHRVYAVDIIGEPGKSSENRPDSRGTNYGEWLVQVMDGLNIEKTTVVGNSLGGWMALSLASYAPNRVESLVLIAPGGFSPIRIGTMLKMLRYSAMGGKGEAKLSKLIYGDMKMPEEVLAFGRLISRYYIPRTIGFGALPDEAFKKLSMPVLFIGGEKDALLPEKRNAKKLKLLVPHAEIRMLPGRPHVLFGLAEDIVAFLT